MIEQVTTLGEYLFQSDNISYGTWNEHTEKHATILFENETVCKYITSKDKFSKEDIAERMRVEKGNYEKTGLQYFPLFLTKTGQFIGSSGLRPYRSSDTVFEIGFYLLEDFHGKGYAFEAAKAAMEYAERRYGIKKFMAGHHPQNTASRGLLTKLGFSHVADELYPPTGLLHPMYERNV